MDLKNIDRLSAQYRFLSNFWEAATAYEGMLFPTTEHAYQAAKTMDLTTRLLFLDKVKSPGEAKRRGRKLVLRPGWEDLKIGIMTEVVRDKFTRHPDLGEKLLATGNARLVKGNKEGDQFWGMCRGRGQNHLGKILMKVRAELRGQL
jgi:ribA/ribD-fused uncharacterized protein